MFLIRPITIWMILLTLAVPVSPVLAAESASASTVSLSELIAEARKANVDLVVARKRWEAAQARIPLARGIPAPRIGVEFEEIPRGTVKLDQAMLMYQLIQSLPFPGKLSARHRVAVAEAQMSAAAYKQTEWSVVNDVKKAYNDIYLIDRERQIGEESAARLSQMAAVAQARYASNQGSYFELLQIQSKAEEAQNNLLILGHRRLSMTAHLNHLLNRPAEQSVGSPGPIPLEQISLSAHELFQKALMSQPELLMFQFSAERAKAAHQLAKRELLPDLETMFALRDPTMGPAGPWDMTLAIALPFWFWTKARYGVKAALYDYESAEAAYVAMRNEIARRIHEHWHMAQAQYTQAVFYRDRLLPLSEQAIQSSLSAYEAGNGSYTELLEALNERAMRRQEYERALTELEWEKVELERVVGVSLRGES